MARILESEAKFIEEVHSLRMEVRPPVVQNLDSGVWHRMAASSSPAWRVGGLRTCCGWRVGASSARLSGAASLPPQ
eukprot:6760540-Lingulodinium_polyedra.AAC.1